MAITKFRAEVWENNLIDGNVHWVKFKLLEPLEIVFQAGQYGTYIINDSTRRTYSFCSSPQQNTLTETCVDTSPEGLGSQWLENLKKGDVVEFLAPLGHFVVDKESPKDIIFVATGTGISAIRSMIADLLSGEIGGDRERKISLVFGVRDEDHQLFFEEFENLAKEKTNFSFYPILSQPKKNWQGKAGRVNNILKTLKAEQLINSKFYLCGNHEMIEGVKKQVLGLGVKIEDIHWEQFY
ncbi:hypothetical protein HY030_01560 [Candidatus Gottesmanbacteria bacterium]|nr:hypothetical protein [Candidatus Gottesmanbacteria bacterium]